MPLAAASVLFASLGIVAAFTVSSSTGGLALLIGAGYTAVMIPAALWITSASLAAHARCITAVTWLGASEDAFGQPWRRRGR